MSAIATQGESFLNEFHSGGGAAVGLYEGTANFANISSTGDLIRWGQAINDVQGSMDWTSVERVLNNAASQKKILILKLWVCNFETVTQSGVQAFITRLNKDAKNLNTYVIWIPAWEFNQAADWGQPQYDHGIGTAGSPRNWYIPASIYVSQMKMIRSMRDSLGAQNVLIGSQPDLCFRYQYPNWAGLSTQPVTGQRTLVNYKDGIDQADVIGCSLYVGLGTTGDQGLTNASIIQAAFDWMHKMHDYIDPTKPFIAFEYNSAVWVNPPGVSQANTFFIQNTYAQVPSNFAWGLRGLVWWCPFSSSSARTKCNNYASQYEGYKNSDSPSDPPVQSSQQATAIYFGFSSNPTIASASVTVKGILVDNSSRPVSNAVVRFQYSTDDGGTWRSSWILITNQYGVFSNVFTAPAAGRYLLKAAYSGDSTHVSSSSTAYLTVGSAALTGQGSIFFNFMSNPATSGSTLSIAGVVLNTSNQPIASAAVTVKYSTDGGKTWLTPWILATNQYGIFSNSFTAPTKGTYLYQAGYQSSVETTYLVVN